MAASTKACVLFAPSEQVKLFAFNCSFIVTGLSGYYYTILLLSGCVTIVNSTSSCKILE